MITYEQTILINTSTDAEGVPNEHTTFDYMYFVAMLLILFAVFCRKMFRTMYNNLWRKKGD